MDEPQWKPAYSLVKILWFDCSVGFDCVCGEKELMMSDDPDKKTCGECGRVYRFSSSFDVQEPPE